MLFASMAAALILASGMALTQTPGTSLSPPNPQPGEGGAIRGEYIVVLEEGVAEPAELAANGLAPRYELEVKRTYRHALKGFAARIPAARLDAVKSDPRVLFVSENRRFYMNNHDQVLTDAVDRIQAERSSATSGNGRGSVDVGIAVIDSGIDARHDDLNVAGGKDCSSAGGAFNDKFDHGTFVAGLAAAKDNHIGVVGVAPGARLYSAKVIGDRPFATTAGIICAVDWVTANAGKIEVANMSVGGPVPNADDGACGLKNREPIHYAICRSVKKGITYAVAAGNSNANIKNDLPSAYDEVLAVTAMVDFDGRPGGQGGSPPCPDEPGERDDTAAFFSNFATRGSEDAAHTIAAPGVCVESTLPGDKYGSSSGTSFSSPLVAGTAALYKARHPNAPPATVIDRLRAVAKAQPKAYGFEGDPRHPIGKRYYGYLVHVGSF